MLRLRTVAILAITVVGLAGCAAVGEGSPSTEPDASTPASGVGIEVGTWTSEDGQAHLALDGGQVRGTDGCNNVTGSYTLEEQTVSFDLGLMTLKACPGVTLSFRTLATGTIDGDRMTLYDRERTELVVLTRG